MWATISGIFSAIRALIDLIKMVNQWRIDQARLAREKAQQDLETAVDKSKGANTDDEIWKNQDDIVSNKPRP